MKRQHAPFMIFVFAALILGVWAGLIRIGWQLPNLHDDFALAHGVLMIGGFMGTLINLERSVALHNFLKSPHLRLLPYLAPLLSIMGAIALVVDLSFAALLMTLSSMGMVLMFAYIVQKHTTLYTLTMAGGALCWWIGNLVWLAGDPLFMSAPWWMAFLILTIAGERLELSRLMRHPQRIIRLFGVAVVGLACGLLMTRFDYDLGIRLMGASNLGIALWLLRYDVVRRTIRQTGLTRFIAMCLAVGYVWLALSGALAVYYGGVKAGMIYDAILHAVFLGFAFSMIFGHAPIILPAVLGINIRYSPLFYLHLALLHASLILRVGGDLTAWQEGRRWGAMLNGVVLLLFMGNTIRTLHTDAGKPLLPRSKSALATYALALPLFLGGFILIGRGMVSHPAESPIIATPHPESSPSANDPALIVAGERLYQVNCAACHGMNLQGITGIGKPLINSRFMAGLDDEELLNFIIQGRPMWDAENTTGVAMPPRGGNNSLSDADIEKIIAFIRAEGGH